jgi:enoyl-CoA hydratase
MYNFKHLKFEMKEYLVGVLTINRPDSLNALNQELLGELLDFLREPPADLRCLVVTGAGEKSFVAGADIKELTELKPEGALEAAERGQLAFRGFETAPFAVIAAVNGFALGGGLELALSCDFIIASEKAKMGLPEVTLGLMPGFGGCVRLPRKVGMQRAMQMMMTGETIKADEAYELGLANEVVAPDTLMTRCMELANKISDLAPIAIKNLKKTAYAAYDQPIDVAMGTERAEFSLLFNTSDMREGTQAFIEKRKAKFTGN